MKKGMLMVVASCAGLGLMAAPEWAVTVDVQTVRGPVKAMNAVNNGPTKPRSDQSRGNFDAYAALTSVADGGYRWMRYGVLPCWNSQEQEHAKTVIDWVAATGMNGIVLYGLDDLWRH